MSWFRRTPHRTEQERRVPRRPQSSDTLTHEIEQNRQRLEQHRHQTGKDQQDGKLH